MKNFWQKNWFIIIVFITVTVIYFAGSLFGPYTIMATDANYSVRLKIAELLKNGIPKLWVESYWLGYASDTSRVSVITLCYRLFDPAKALTIGYILSVAMSLSFTYLFLRSLKLNRFAAIFGAVAYSFTPHILTLIYSGHYTVVGMLPYPPAVLYFLTVAYKKDEPLLKSLLALVIAGVFWGVMMSEDVQRGLYFSVPIALFILNLLFDKDEVQVKSLFKGIFTKKFLLDFAKVLITAVFLLASFYSSLKSWLGSEVFADNSTATENPIQETDQQKWDFATSWSLHPGELIDSAAFGYHGAISGDSEKPYWGDKPFSGNSEALGFFVILLAVFGVVLGYKKEGKTRFFLWVGVAALLLAFGKYWPGKPFFWLFYKLPYMDKFRVPAKFVAVAAFSFSILAAYGMHFVVERIKDNKKDDKFFDLSWKILAGVLGAGVLWLLVAAASSTSIASSIARKFGNNTALGTLAAKNMVNSLLRMNVFVLLSAAVFFLIDKMRNSKPKDGEQKTYHGNLASIFGAFFILLILVDLFSIDAFYLKKSYVKLDEFYASDGVIGFLKNDPTQYRVAMSLTLPQGNTPAPIPTTGLRGHYLTYLFPYYDIESIDVPAVSRMDPYYGKYFIDTLTASLYNPAVVNVTNLQAVLNGQSYDFTDLINLNIRLFQLANVKYLITDGYPIPQRPDYMVYSLVSNTNLIFTNSAYGVNGSPHYTFYVKNTLPRAGFYENFLTVPNNDDALAYITSANFNIKNIVLVNSPASPVIENYNEVAPLTAVEYKPWYAKYEVDAPKAGVVLYNIKYDPAWKAFIDGQPATIFKANFIAQGVFVEAGKHIVEFKYMPDTKPFKVSLYVTLLGLAALAVLITFMLINNKKLAGRED